MICLYVLNTLLPNKAAVLCNSPFVLSLKEGEFGKVALQTDYVTTQTPDQSFRPVTSSRAVENLRVGDYRFSSISVTLLLSTGLNTDTFGYGV